MGCEQLVQHAKVSKNRKFIPHFRENLARPLDKGGVGVVYLPCNPQSAASVREVINTANRLIHRVTAEVINPFQQLSTLYRHVVDTSPPPRAHRRSGLQPRHSIVPSVHSRTATRFPAAPLTAAPFYLHRSAVFPPCHSIAVLLFAVPLLCCTEASLSFSRFTAAPLYRCSVSSLYSGIAPPVFPSRLCRFAASPVSAPSARKPFPALCFSFSGMPLPPFPGMSVCPASAPAGYPEASATEPPTRRQLSAPHPKSRSTSWLGRFHPRRSNRGPCGSAAPERRMEGRGDPPGEELRRAEARADRTFDGPSPGRAGTLTERPFADRGRVTERTLDRPRP